MADLALQRIPFYVDTPDGALCVCLHTVDSLASVGVLLCSPFGREELSAYLALKELADRLAVAGLPAMRFDYLASGDSALDASQASLDLWVRSALAAADALKRAARVKTIVVAGARLGATIGWMAASERCDVLAYIGIVPVVHGKAFLRELRALQAASPAPDVAAPGEMLESGGFHLSATFRDQVQAVDLRQAKRMPASDVLLIDREELPSATPMIEALRALGSRVEHRCLPGYAGLSANPQDAAVPEEMWHCIVDAARRFGALSVPTGISGELGEALPHYARIGDVVESIESIDAATGKLQAVLTQPAAAVASGHLMIWLNAGAVRRIGLSRLHVDLARRWAARGHSVVRLDLAGLGDSEPQEAGRNVVYAPDAVTQVIDAVEVLRLRCQARHVHLLGLCAGAYHGLKAAVRGARADSVVAINPLTFFWHDGMSLEEPMHSYRVKEDFTRYRRRMMSWKVWSKVLRGDIDLARPMLVVLERARALIGSQLCEFARLVRFPLRDDLVTEIRSLVDRRVSLSFLFAEGDPGHALLSEQGGRAVRRWLADGTIGLATVPNADHTFSRAGARQVLCERLDEWVRRVEHAQPPHSVSGGDSRVSAATRPIAAFSDTQS